MSSKKPPEDGQELYLTMDYVIDVGNPIVSLHYDPILETIIIACERGPKDKKLTHWSIPQLKKMNILDDGEYGNELAVVTWSKEQQGKNSNVERQRLSGFNIDTTKYNNNHELHGLEESIVVSSDKSGTVYIWNFDNKKQTSPNENDDYSPLKLIKKDESGANILTPLRVFNLHEGPLTSILIDAFKIVTAGSDGKVNIIDSLNSTLIRTFYCRKSKNNPKNVNVMRHYNIINGMEMDKYQICVTFGNSIKVWDFDTERVKESKKKNKTSKEILSLKLARNKTIMEDYKTSYEMLEKEKMQKQVNSKNFKRFNGSINEELTEEELMAYAMMLSMDQKEQVVSSSSKTQGKTDDVDDDFEYDPSQFESDQEEIPEDYVDEQEKRDFLYASELAKQDMYMEKLTDELHHSEDHYDEDYYDGEEENGISAEQYFKEEKMKQEERKKKIHNNYNHNNNSNNNNKNNSNSSRSSNSNKNTTNNKALHSFNPTNKSDNDFIDDAIQDFLNDTQDTPITISNPSSTSTSPATILKNKYEEDDEENHSKSKGGKKGKGKKNKGKKKSNFIPLDEWQSNHQDYDIDDNLASYDNDYNNTSNTKDPADMDEEEYLNYILKLSLHDK